MAFLTGVQAGERPASTSARCPITGATRMFGGSIIGQSVTALTREVPDDRRLHSLHGYFVRPTTGGAPIDYVVDTIRDGRNFSRDASRASQSGKTIFEGIGSFTTDTDGYLYDLPHTSALPAREDGERRPRNGWRRGVVSRLDRATRRRHLRVDRPQVVPHARRHRRRRPPAHRLLRAWRRTGRAWARGRGYWAGTTTSTASPVSITRCGSTAPRASPTGISTTCTRWSTSAVAVRCERRSATKPAKSSSRWPKNSCPRALTRFLRTGN